MFALVVLSKILFVCETPDGYTNWKMWPDAQSTSGQVENVWKFQFWPILAIPLRQNTRPPRRTRLCRILPTFISNGLIWKSLLTVAVMLTLQQQEGQRGKKKKIWRFRSVTVGESLKSEGHGGGSETLLTSLWVFPPLQESRAMKRGRGEVGL